MHVLFRKGARMGARLSDHEARVVVSKRAVVPRLEVEPSSENESSEIPTSEIVGSTVNLNRSAPSQHERSL